MIEDKEKRIGTITAELDPYKDGNDSPVRVAMHEALEALHHRADYYVSSSGDIFVKRIC